MKKVLILASALTGALLAVPAFAETPNRVTMSFPEFVAASGCVLVDKGGYQNIEAASGGNCPINVAARYAAAGTGAYLDTDDNPATDPVWVNDEN